MSHAILCSTGYPEFTRDPHSHGDQLWQILSTPPAVPNRNTTRVRLLSEQTVPAVETGEPLVRLESPTIPRVSDLRGFHTLRADYSVPHTLVRASVRQRLQEALAYLPHPKLGFAVFDGWRSPHLQTRLHGATQATRHKCDPCFVAEPSNDPALPPPHVSGGAIDVTLSWEGEPLSLGTAFGDYCADTNPYAFSEVDTLVGRLRGILRSTLHKAGFAPDDMEWWHFELGTPRWSAVTGEPARFGATQPE